MKTSRNARNMEMDKMLFSNEKRRNDIKWKIKQCGEYKY